MRRLKQRHSVLLRGKESRFASLYRKIPLKRFFENFIDIRQGKSGKTRMITKITKITKDGASDGQAPCGRAGGNGIGFEAGNKTGAWPHADSDAVKKTLIAQKAYLLSKTIKRRKRDLWRPFAGGNPHDRSAGIPALSHTPAPTTTHR
jgi:hypothetical protein